nr:hypothetical protein Iba_chr02bCG20180 [Ipomoea batatas]
MEQRKSRTEEQWGGEEIAGNLGMGFDERKINAWFDGGGIHVPVLWPVVSAPRASVDPRRPPRRILAGPQNRGGNSYRLLPMKALVLCDDLN